ncbi:E3 ubiquitin-protein ligase UBR1 [Gryllus bimaculatus]|nr:E3 ubiquitin-protein ligase UBR1 [Gryllus bimaculatus]
MEWEDEEGVPGGSSNAKPGPDAPAGPPGYSVAVGPRQTERPTSPKTFTCIVCAREDALHPRSPVMVLPVVVQRSSVMCRSPSMLPSHKLTYLHGWQGPGVHVSSCGHAMHRNCYLKCLDEGVRQLRRRPAPWEQPRPKPVVINRFYCPLCHFPSTTVMPLVPPLVTLHPTVKRAQYLGFVDWLEGLRITLRLSHIERPRPVARFFGSRATRARKSGSGKSTSAASTSRTSLGRGQHALKFNRCSLKQVIAAMGCNGDKFAWLFPGTLTPAAIVLSKNLRNMVDAFSLIICAKGLGNPVVISDRKVSLMMAKTCAYTILALENVLRADRRPLVGDLPKHQEVCCDGLVRLLSILGSSSAKPRNFGNNALLMLKYILEAPSDGPCLFEWDPFGMLVTLSSCMQALFLTDTLPPVPTGDLQSHYLLTLLFIANCVKAMLTFDSSNLQEAISVQNGEHERALKPLITLMKIALTATGIAPYRFKVPSGRQLLSHIYAASLPFLRCCALFFHFLTGVPVPVALSESQVSTHETQFSELCAYLDLPVRVCDLLGTSVARELAQTWCKHPRVKEFLMVDRYKSMLRLPAPVKQLVPLPTKFRDLVAYVAWFECPIVDREGTFCPTVCLVCKEILCLKCRGNHDRPKAPLRKGPGACTQHARNCGAGLGLFLRVPKCDVMVLDASGQGCFLAAPYVDKHGETDPGLLRGHPLHLCQKSYQELTHMWLNHSLYKKIAEETERTGKYAWHHM